MLYRWVILYKHDQQQQTNQQKKTLFDNTVVAHWTSSNVFSESYLLQYKVMLLECIAWLHGSLNIVCI